MPKKFVAGRFAKSRKLNSGKRKLVKRNLGTVDYLTARLKDAAKQALRTYSGTPTRPRKNSGGLRLTSPLDFGSSMFSNADLQTSPMQWDGSALGVPTAQPRSSTQTTTRRKRRGATFRTSAVGPGKYKGLIKTRGKASKGRRFGYNGYTEFYEAGGVIQDTQCVYLGHACNLKALKTSFWHAFVSYMYSALGEPVSSWGDSPYNSYKGVLAWRNVQNFEFIFEGYFDMKESSTYEAIANYFENRVDLLFPNSNYDMDFKCFRVYEPQQIVVGSLVVDDTLTNDPNVTPETDLGKFRLDFRLDDLVLEFEYNSGLVIQNETLAGIESKQTLADKYEDPTEDPTQGKDDAAPIIAMRESRMSIYNHPLRVVKYDSRKKWFNGFECKENFANANAGLPNNINFIAHETGLIYNRAFTEMNSQWYKPPPTFHFKNKIVAHTISLDPGNSKTDKQKFRCKMSINKILKKFMMKTVFQGLSQKYRHIDYGWATLFACERRMDSRFNENPIVIHYELHNTTRCRVLKMKKRPPTSSLMNVVNTRLTDETEEELNPTEP